MRTRTRVEAFVLTSIAAFFFSSSVLLAEPVRVEQAQKVTGAFLKTRNVGLSLGSKTLLTTDEGQVVGERVTLGGLRLILADDGTVLAYVTDLEPRGFVATSADTAITPIVAYSFRSSFPADNSGDNPLYRLLKEDMKLRRKALAEREQSGGPEPVNLWNFYAGEEMENSETGTLRQWPEENITSTGGWLDTAWHQDAPYNDLCPLDPADSNRCYVGCVATALAQLVNYHKLCGARFDQSDTYTTFAGVNFDGDSDLYDFPSFEELNEYLAIAQSKVESQIDLNDTDIAALSFACGIATRMDYSSKGSGASPYALLDALQNKFGFYSAEMTGGLSSEYHQVLQENLINGTPALLSIAPTDSWGGHLVVCDGYNSDGEYHLNFGWGSPHPEEITEVWYRLPGDLMLDLSLVTEAILNIRPYRPEIEVDPGSLTFYAVPGDESQQKTLRIENSVPNVEINSISCPAGFVMARWGEPYSNHIDSFQFQSPGSQTLVYVKFCPQEPRGYYGTLTVDYSNGSRKHVILKGYSYTGGTEIPAGDVSGTWSQAESPYFVSGDIEIAANSQLVIEPGVRVLFVGPYGMTVGYNARLTAEGNAGNPIEFTAWNTDVGWRGLRFLDSGGDDVLSYCSISFSKKNAGLIAGNDAVGGYNPFMDEQNDCGGAVYCYWSDVFIANSRISNNVGDMGGAIFCAESNPRIVNTVIANNASVGGEIQCGGISTDMWSNPIIQNCTIVNNSPGGAFLRSWEPIEMTNTIMWGNERYQILTEECAPVVTFCDIEGGYEGEGNIDADPCFFDPSAGIGPDFDATSTNWALRSDSPCINSGTPALLPEADPAGAPRVHADIIDIGAYENQSDLPLISIGPSANIDAGFAHLDAGATIGVTIINSGLTGFQVEGLSLDDPEGVFSIASTIENQHVQPGESIPVQIRFAPTAERKYAATLHVHSTCSNAPDKQIALRAVGVSGTVISGANRRGDTASGTWTRAQSPYTITADVEIPQGQMLTIEPGVEVKFAGHFKFTVGHRATLRAIGTEAENIVFTATDPNEGWFGLRFVNTGSDDVLEHCTIEYSKKHRTGGGGGFENHMGGAIVCYSSWDAEPGYPVTSNPTINNCLIRHNRADYGGAIMCTDDSQARIGSSRIVDNKADSAGGALYVTGASPHIANNIIAHNSAGIVGGGIMNWLATPSITNNTIAHNRPSGLHLDITTWYPWLRNLPSPVLNNIVWQNEIYLYEDVASDEYDIRFNDVQGGWQGEGNIDVDPLFADAENRDYHLKSETGRWDPASESWTTDDVTSPCIDAGDPAETVADEPAANGDRINMGAYGGTTQASKSSGGR
ncbi:MAG: C10 family peptidase [Planctomycetota bacterium]|jgi:hypothetical protein